MERQREAEFVDRLASWYADNMVEFPWRQSQDPYHALVGAVCTQQTQMSRAIETYSRWIEAFPTIADLADAPEEEVLRIWGRSGYPRRAIYLRRAAEVCCSEYGGVIPCDELELLSLPGVGPFTAGIVRCFGFGIQTLTVDTNVIRILGRVFHGDLQPVKETAIDEIRLIGETLLGLSESEQFNAAVMDFGAAVCTSQPRCTECTFSTEQLCLAAERFLSGEKAVTVGESKPFSGSDRELRGKVLEVLRGQRDPVAIEKITVELRTDLDQDEERFEAILAGLEKDSLIWRSEQRAGLGTIDTGQQI